MIFFLILKIIFKNFKNISKNPDTYFFFLKKNLKLLQNTILLMHLIPCVSLVLDEEELGKKKALNQIDS